MAELFIDAAVVIRMAVQRAFALNGRLIDEEVEEQHRSSRVDIIGNELCGPNP